MRKLGELKNKVEQKIDENPSRAFAIFTTTITVVGTAGWIAAGVLKRKLAEAEDVLEYYEAHPIIRLDGQPIARHDNPDIYDDISDEKVLRYWQSGLRTYYKIFDRTEEEENAESDGTACRIGRAYDHA